MLPPSHSPLHSWRQKEVRYHPACIGGIESDHQCRSVWTRVVLQTQQTQSKAGYLFTYLTSCSCTLPLSDTQVWLRNLQPAEYRILLWVQNCPETRINMSHHHNRIRKEAVTNPRLYPKTKYTHTHTHACTHAHYTHTHACTHAHYTHTHKLTSSALEQCTSTVEYSLLCRSVSSSKYSLWNCDRMVLWCSWYSNKRSSISLERPLWSFVLQ